MLSWFVNPWMLGLGGLAVSVPIIIHLLNKRRFRVVQWAAMDFLFDADKKNRRRVRIENLLLLLLRCLAMLLIGLSLARPFLPTQLANLVQQDAQLERVVLLDDSLSTRVSHGASPGFDVARESLKRLIAELAESDASDDWLTLFTTSQPDQPILANEPITKNTLPTLIETIDGLESSDFAADYVRSLQELQQYVSGMQNNVGRVVYVLSDMRNRDWIEGAGADPESAPNRVLNEIARSAADCYLVDMAADDGQNLAIVNLRPLDLQVAGKVVRYSVNVANFGTSTVRNVRILLQVDDSPPQYQTVPSIAPGQVEELVFPYLFAETLPDSMGVPEPEDSAPAFTHHRIRAEIDRPSMSAAELKADTLVDDSRMEFAARVLEGIPVLLVDGDPQAISERSDTHYLRALDVPGTGLNIRTVTVGEFETVSLSRYRVIFLCNVDEASPDRILALEQWVQDGGGLILMPGNKVRARVFNESFYRNGLGLAPLRLDSIAGDPTMGTWVNFEVDPQVHPALRVIVDSDRTSLSRVDIFSWWHSQIDDEAIGKSISVPLRMTDPQQSPAMVERRWGAGTVVAFTIPADGDWSMWPSSPTYAPVLIDLIDYLVGTVSDTSTLAVGGTISWLVDLSVYDSRVSLRDPSGDRVEAMAKPVETSEAGRGTVLYRVQFDPVQKRGFYEIGLRRHSGETDTILFASKLDPSESRLKRLAESTTDGDFFDSAVQRIAAGQLRSEQIERGNTEIWPRVLVLLLGVLGLEQILGWWFGRKR